MRARFRKETKQRANSASERNNSMGDASEQRQQQQQLQQLQQQQQQQGRRPGEPVPLGTVLRPPGGGDGGRGRGGATTTTSAPMPTPITLATNTSSMHPFTAVLTGPPGPVSGTTVGAPLPTSVSDGSTTDLAGAQQPPYTTGTATAMGTATTSADIMLPTLPAMASSVGPTPLASNSSGAPQVAQAGTSLAMATDTLPTPSIPESEMNAYQQHQQQQARGMQMPGVYAQHQGVSAATTATAQQQPPTHTQQHMYLQQQPTHSFHPGVSSSFGSAPPQSTAYQAVSTATSAGAYGVGAAVSGVYTSANGMGSLSSPSRIQGPSQQQHLQQQPGVTMSPTSHAAARSSAGGYMTSPPHTSSLPHPSTGVPFHSSAQSMMLSASSSAPTSTAPYHPYRPMQQAPSRRKSAASTPRRKTSGARRSPAQSPAVGMTPVGRPPVRSCNCGKSRCLKLYCECYAAGTYCGPQCKCQNCQNNQENESRRRLAVMLTLDKNPDAFRPKIKQETTTSRKANHLKGCKCTKSKCLQRYCECFQAGVPCTSNCKCKSCCNRPNSDAFQLLQTQRASTESSQGLVDSNAAISNRSGQVLHTLTQQRFSQVCQELLLAAEHPPESQNSTQAVLSAFDRQFNQVMKDASTQQDFHPNVPLRPSQLPAPVRPARTKPRAARVLDMGDL